MNGAHPQRGSSFEKKDFVTFLTAFRHHSNINWMSDPKTIFPPPTSKHPFLFFQKPLILDDWGKEKDDCSKIIFSSAEPH